MVFKGRFFSSKKSSGTSSSEGSNSPRSIGSNSNSPIRSEKKVKPKSTATEEDPHRPAIRQSQLKDSSTSTSNLKTHIPVSTTPTASSKSTVSPILASSLGLNRIKTRSGPLHRESFLGFNSNNNNANTKSNLSKAKNSDDDSRSFKKKNMPSSSSSSFENASASDATIKSLLSRDQTPNVLGRSPLRNGESSSSEAGRLKSRGYSGGLRSSEICTPEMKTSYDCENPKESESPRFQAILRVTSAPRKKYPADIKSFSHELNSEDVRPFPLWKPRSLNNVEEVLSMIRGKFDKAKEVVDADLRIFAGDLLGILEKNAESQPQWQEILEDLLLLAQRCAMSSPGEFWLQCESIVQELEDMRRQLPMGILKQLHARMLFILTRCTRLLQFHKESGLAEDELVLQLRQSLHLADKHIPLRPSKPASTRKSFSQEQHGLHDLKKEKAIQIQQPAIVVSPPTVEIAKNLDSGRDRMASWKKFPSLGAKSPQEEIVVKE